MCVCVCVYGRVCLCRSILPSSRAQYQQNVSSSDFCYGVCVCVCGGLCVPFRLQSCCYSLSIILIFQEGAVRLLKLPGGSVKFHSSAKNQEMKELSEANATMKSKVGRNNGTGTPHIPQGDALNS